MAEGIHLMPYEPLGHETVTQPPFLNALKLLTSIGPWRLGGRRLFQDISIDIGPIFKSRFGRPPFKQVVKQLFEGRIF